MEIVLSKGSRLSGRVVDQEQRPIAGVEIKADHGCKDRFADCCNMVQFHILRRQTVTDANGCFALDDMPIWGSLKLVAIKRISTFTIFVDNINFPHPDSLPITFCPLPSMTVQVLDDETNLPITDFSITPGFKFSDYDAKHFYDPIAVNSPTGIYTETGFHVAAGFKAPELTARIEAAGYESYIVPPIHSNLMPNPVIVRLKKNAK
jgi:hypothetical protein